jgi:pimeloyl-ACP methyl ester carboxylesterase
VSVPPFVTLPTGVRRARIETSRGTFAALEALPGSRPPERRPALLVPGYTGSKEDFIAMLPALTEAGRRVIAIDQRGQYETPGSDDPAAYTCAALGADITSLLEKITRDDPGRVHVLGHSFGGLVTREAVIADPSPVASLTLMGSGPAALGEPSASKARTLIDALAVFQLAQIWDGFLGPQAATDGLTPDVIAFLRKRMVGNSPTALTCMGQELMSTPDRVDRLAKVIAEAGLSALVLFGENDDAWEPSVQAAMANRLEAHKVVIPGAAHSPAAEAPEITATALTTFWNEAERHTHPPAPSSSAPQEPSPSA